MYSGKAYLVQQVSPGVSHEGQHKANTKIIRGETSIIVSQFSINDFFMCFGISVGKYCMKELRVFCLIFCLFVSSKCYLKCSALVA